MIAVRRLVKTYRVPERPPGLGAAFASLFRRRYTTVRAVDDVSFDIAPGERVGFLGPNGAGKTTTLKVLSGLLHPTSGEVRVGGHVPARRDDAFLRSIMLVTGQKQQLLWDLPAADTFELNRALYEVPRAEFDATLRELTELLELAPLVKKPVRQLSLGERMKCELAAALVHRPRVLFLDEPTIGLDVTARAAVRSFIKRYNEEHGATLLLTSHDMDDVTALCPRIVIIDRGRLAFDGPQAELVLRARPQKRVVLELASPAPAEALAGLGAEVVESGPARVVLLAPTSEISRVVGLALARLPVRDLTIEAAELEEVLGEMFARGRPAGPKTEGE
ncbi:MAG TPA: ATP-binding cassette domain-containing protein [Polyangiaceae bacterium]|nr:ATP-binding cassette domain-containing protein [Polyangiaceae bacterium]